MIENYKKQNWKFKMIENIKLKKGVGGTALLHKGSLPYEKNRL